MVYNNYFACCECKKVFHQICVKGKLQTYFLCASCFWNLRILPPPAHEFLECCGCRNNCEPKLSILLEDICIRNNLLDIPNETSIYCTTVKLDHEKQCVIIKKKPSFIAYKNLTVLLDQPIGKICKIRFIASGKNKEIQMHFRVHNENSKQFQTETLRELMGIDKILLNCTVLRQFCSPITKHNSSKKQRV